MPNLNVKACIKKEIAMWNAHNHSKGLEDFILQVMPDQTSIQCYSNYHGRVIHMWDYVESMMCESVSTPEKAYHFVNKTRKEVLLGKADFNLDLAVYQNERRYYFIDAIFNSDDDDPDRDLIGYNIWVYIDNIRFLHKMLRKEDNKLIILAMNDCIADDMFKHDPHFYLVRTSNDAPYKWCAVNKTNNKMVTWTTGNYGVETSFMFFDLLDKLHRLAKYSSCGLLQPYPDSDQDKDLEKI